jgi:hypothetical protein
MKVSLTLGPMAVSPTDAEQLPENPVATVAAYLAATYPGYSQWVVLNEPGDSYARKAWYMADDAGEATGAPCATITVEQD